MRRQGEAGGDKESPGVRRLLGELCVYLPPVAVKQLLVEDSAIGTEKVNRIKVGWVNRILKWYNILDRNETTGDIRQDNHDSCHIPGDKKMSCQVNNIISSDLQADAVLLTLSVRVRVVTSKDETVTSEGGLLYGRHDGIVHSGLPRYRVLQPVQRVVAFILHGEYGVQRPG